MSSLVTLLKNTKLDSPEDVLKTANEALKKSKVDITAQHLRVVALLKLERYEDVLKTFDSSGEKLKSQAVLEYAYALYKCNKPEEAQKVVKSSRSDERGLLHVAAQSAYRLEDFDASSQIYKQLAQSDKDEEYDLKINRSAVDAQLEWSGSGDRAVSRKPEREDLDAFESAYNAACGCIARGELAQAGIFLNRAKQLCEASQDLSEDDKKNELVPILIQQTYIACTLGRQEEAAKFSKNLDLKDISDMSLRHIGQVNSLAATPQPNPFLAHRIFHSTPEIPKKDAPFQFQQTILRQNSYALDLQANKFDGASKSTSAIVSSEHHPSDSASINTLSVINAAAKSHNEEGSRAIKSILPLLQKRPTDVGVLLILIQLNTLKNNHSSATSLLESFFANLDSSTHPSAPAVRHAPGLIAVAVALYNSQGRHSHSRALLASAAKYWRTSAQKTSIPPNTTLLKTAGTALLQSGEKEDAQEAADIFSDLYSRNPNDKAAAAGLVAATCLTNPASLDQALLKKLTPPSRLTAGIDAAALEAAGIARAPDSVVPESKKRAAAATAGPGLVGERKKTKLPKSRMPKEYVEGKVLDPDRWLPLRDRASWRPKGRKGKAKAAGLTQGGPVEEEKVKSEATKVVVGSQANKGKKKKAKGGKW